MSLGEHGVDKILEHLRQTRGFDFTAYKRTSLTRRIQKRMHTVGLESEDYEAYLDRLQVDHAEFGALFNTILINVTSFFRDPDMWEQLRTQVLPELPVLRANDGPIRIWSAGCASGEEPFTAAIVLAELVGLDAIRERVKIYATDVDVEALGEARRAVYTGKQLADMPPGLMAKYFTRNGDGDTYVIDRDLRRCVIFGAHDLIQDAPISRVDLLLCRNTLMYFNSDAQSRIMGRFAMSLNAHGYLVLGRAEMLFSYAASFTPVDLKRRIFRTTARMSSRDRAHLAALPREGTMPHDITRAQLRDAAFENDPEPQVTLDAAGAQVAANAAARRLFRLSGRDIGTPVHGLEISYKPADLRSAIDRVRAEQRDVVLPAVTWDGGGGPPRFFDVTVAPVFSEDRAMLGVRVRYADVTPVKNLQEELTRSKQELETAYEELQSTNEELETTNEELQSTVEELETTNEELHSTNEELETMNEELQSSSEELQTMNDELRNRSLELNSSNAFLESVFTSLRAAVVVVDNELRVQVWNAGALDMWGLRADEARGTAFFNLDVGLPVAALLQPLRDVLSGARQQAEVVLAATNRKGRAIRCRVSVSPLLSADRTPTGAILLMEEEGDPR